MPFPKLTQNESYLNVKHKTIKLLENNIGENLNDLWYCVAFLDTTPNTWSVAEIIDKLDFIKIKNSWASLVAQWLRICLPMQGTQVQALVWEDPTCHRATGPVSHNYWACAPGACAPQQERPRQWEASAPRWRVAPLATTRESPRTEMKTQHSHK